MKRGRECEVMVGQKIMLQNNNYVRYRIMLFVTFYSGTRAYNVVACDELRCDRKEGVNNTVFISSLPPAYVQVVRNVGIVH